jgi:hypothetical protein
VLWNQGVQTDKEVMVNRPDIIIKNRKDETCILKCDNTMQKEAKRKL